MYSIKKATIFIIISMVGFTVLAKDCAVKWITVGLEPNIEINGLAWFDENNSLYYRLPVREKENITNGAWLASKCPSGARVRFKTDSTQLKLSINHGMDKKSNVEFDPWLYNYVKDYMSPLASRGIDLYRDEPGNMSYCLTTVPTEISKHYIHTFNIMNPSRQMREFTLYLPVYGELAELKIGVDPNAVIQKPTEYKIKKPIVFYGTSITQGGYASRGSNSFAAIVGRRLNADIVNLGFAGSGCGEEIMAKLMTEIGASVYVVDSVANMNSQLMKERYEKFITILRQTKPNIPVVLMTRFKYTHEYRPDTIAIYDEQHEPLFATYEKLKKQGDENIYLFDAATVIKPGGDHPTVDGGHLSDTGFYVIADALTPFLKKILPY